MFKTSILALSALALGAGCTTNHNYYGGPGGGPGGRQMGTSVQQRSGGSFTRFHNNTTGEEFCKDDRTGRVFSCPDLPPMRN